MAQSLTLVRGVSGSGKTEFTQFLLDLNPYVQCFAADDWFYDADGNYNFDASKLCEAHAWCKMQVMQAFQDPNVHVVVHNTFTTDRELAPYLEFAQELGIKVRVLVIENRRGGSSVHDVPSLVLDRQRNRLKGSIQL